MMCVVARAHRVRVRIQVRPGILRPGTAPPATGGPDTSVCVLMNFFVPFVPEASPVVRSHRYGFVPANVVSATSLRVRLFAWGMTSETAWIAAWRLFVSSPKVDDQVYEPALLWLFAQAIVCSHPA